MEWQRHGQKAGV
jgi:hypothetical protein